MQLLRESFLLQRRINVPLFTIEQALGLGFRSRGDANLTATGLSLNDGFDFVPSWPRHCWRGRGRLTNDRGRKIALVDVEFGMWSDDAAELVVRPVARYPYRWSGRRQRAYFRAAHDACDQLLQTTTTLAMFERDELVEAR
jgi:hypothetical protein